VFQRVKILSKTAAKERGFPEERGFSEEERRFFEEWKYRRFSKNTETRGLPKFREAAKSTAVKTSAAKWWWIVSNILRVVTIFPCTHWTTTFIFVLILVFTSTSMFMST
jgi:hypothetical protein